MSAVRRSRVTDWIREHASARPDDEAVVCGATRLSYADLSERVDIFAKGLVAAGVRSGDRVAVLAPPCADAIVSFLATGDVGAIWLGLNPRHKRDELALAIGDAEPCLVFTIRAAADELAEVAASAPSGIALIAGAESLAAFLNEGGRIEDRTLLERRGAVDARDPCMIVYTSGSTGRPKGALLHHAGIVDFSTAQNGHWPLSRTVLLNFFPINHVGSICDTTCPTLVAGGKLVLLERFDPARALALIAAEGVTLWGAVPTVFEMQVTLPDFADHDLSSVELIVWEGAAMPEPLIRRLREICPRLATNYGMTETTSAMTVVDPTDDLDVLAGSVGLPLEGVELRLAREDGSVVGEVGEPGEIQSRSGNNMLGYWRRSDATAAAHTPDGWFRTGDLGVWRDDGRLTVIGRLGDMFKSGGYNVYPREVEAVLERHDLVRTAVVVGVPHPLWQEAGVAFVEAATPVSTEELRAHCDRHIANYKVPKLFRVVETLPVLPIGKVDKARLKSLARDAFAERS